VDKLKEEHFKIKGPLENTISNAKQEVASYQRELSRNQEISRQLVNDMGKVNQEAAKWQNESIISQGRGAFSTDAGRLTTRDYQNSVEVRSMEDNQFSIMDTTNN